MFLRRRPHFPNFPERPADVHRCLLVANNCAPTPRLCQMMADRCDRGPCEMHVLVSRARRVELVSDPALRPRGSAAEASIRIDDQRWDVAEARLDSFMRALGDLGQPLSGEILAGSTIRKIRDLLRCDDFDEVVVLAPGDRPRWPSRDLVAKIRRLSQIPVVALPVDELVI